MLNMVQHVMEFQPNPNFSLVNLNELKHLVGERVIQKMIGGSTNRHLHCYYCCNSPVAINSLRCPISVVNKAFRKRPTY